MNLTALFLQWPRSRQPLWARTDPYIPWKRGEETLNEEETLAGGIVTVIIIPTVCYSSHLNSIFLLNRNKLPSVTCSNSSVYLIDLLTAINLWFWFLVWERASWSRPHGASVPGARTITYRVREAPGAGKNHEGARGAAAAAGAAAVRAGPASREEAFWHGWQVKMKPHTVALLVGEIQGWILFWIWFFFFGSSSEKTTGPINVWLWTTATAAQTFLGRNVIRTLTTGIGAVTRTTWRWTGATALGEWGQTETVR